MGSNYEALLRTELDRIAAGEKPTPDFRARAAAAMTSQGDASEAPILCREEPWKPNAVVLPALQQRVAAAEQFRKLRSRLLEYRSNAPLKVVLISSALPREGKSFVAVNLAVSLTQHRATRVLLIDGDLRRYSLHNYLGCSAELGLANFLLGTASPVEVMQRPDAECIEANPGLKHLTFIAGGHGGNQVADLSEDSRFGELIQYAAPHFDWIIIDSSPVTLVSDAVNLARHCDGVLLVVRGGVTKYQVAQKAHAQLQAANMLGVVLNAVEKESGDSYYGYTY